jgi:hypothetical protein
MRRTLRFVLASLVLAASLLAQKPVATVQGRVLGPDGLPMPNVEVHAKAGVRDDAILAKAGLEREQVDLFVLHQANAYMLEHLRKKLRAPRERFVGTCARWMRQLLESLPWPTVARPPMPIFLAFS